MFKRILIVCVGNICRSPTAEYILGHRLEGRGIEVSSAGLAALVERPMDPLALQLLREHGIDGTPHRARQLCSELLRRADLVLGMEAGHVAAIRRMAPEASGKTFVYDKWGAGADIPDPYRQQRPAFEHVYGLIARGTDEWLRYL